MIIRNADKEVAAWAGHLLGTEFVPPYIAWGYTDRLGKLCGAVVMNDYADRNIELTFVGRFTSGTAISRNIASYCFRDLGCERITFRTRARNEAVRGLIKRTGAVQEGLLRRWYGDDDAALYGLLREECRFLR